MSTPAILWMVFAVLVLLEGVLIVIALNGLRSTAENIRLKLERIFR